MKLTIIKINEPIYSGNFDKVYLPTTDGDIEIMPGHAPYMAGLKKGVIRYTAGEERGEIKIEKGFVEINKLEVLVIL